MSKGGGSFVSRLHVLGKEVNGAEIIYNIIIHQGIDGSATDVVRMISCLWFSFCICYYFIVGA